MDTSTFDMTISARLVVDGRLALEASDWRGAPQVSRDGYYRLLVVHEGLLLGRLDLDEVRVAPGSVLCVSRGQRLELRASRASASVITFAQEFFCVRLSRHEVFCDAVIFNRARGVPVVELPAPLHGFTRTLLALLSREAANHEPYGEALVLTQLKLLLLLIARVRLQASQPTASHPRLCPQTLAFQDAVERHHHRERTVAYYARALALTPAALNRAIVRDLGRTASELIHERVAVEARRLLLDGRLSVKEIAAALGFDDPGHFSRYFKRATGRAPSQFVAPAR